MSPDKVFKITEAERKAIRKSYDRTDEEIEEDVQSLKDWLKKQPHLPQDEDDTRLRMMLHHNKFSLEKTKKKLDMYYSVRNIVPEFFSNREPNNPLVANIMDHMTVLPLPNLAANVNRVYMFKFNNDDASKFNMNVYFKMVFGMFDLRIMHDASAGDIFVIDMQHIAFGHLVQFTPVVVKKSYDVIQKAYSDKIKGVHFVHLPAIANTLVTLVNAILSEKLANRVLVHKEMKSLHEYVPAEVLPNEYGGSAGPLKDLYEEWREYFESQNDWLKKQGERKSDESKRIGEPISSDLFGMCGSFRKLTLD